MNQEDSHSHKEEEKYSIDSIPLFSIGDFVKSLQLPPSESMDYLLSRVEMPSGMDGSDVASGVSNLTVLTRPRKLRTSGFLLDIDLNKAAEEEERADMEERAKMAQTAKMEERANMEKMMKMEGREKLAKMAKTEKMMKIEGKEKMAEMAERPKFEGKEKMAKMVERAEMEERMKMDERVKIEEMAKLEERATLAERAKMEEMAKTERAKMAERGNAEEMEERVNMNYHIHHPLHDVALEQDEVNLSDGRPISPRVHVAAGLLCDLANLWHQNNPGPFDASNKKRRRNKVNSLHPQGQGKPKPTTTHLACE